MDKQKPEGSPRPFGFYTQHLLNSTGATRTLTKLEAHLGADHPNIAMLVNNLGKVRVGQTANLRVPSLTDKTFAGKVAFNASESEFKPANIYNSQERSEIVFAVRITVPNPNGELKAGLPADATLGK